MSLHWNGADMMMALGTGDNERTVFRIVREENGEFTLSLVNEAWSLKYDFYPTVELAKQSAEALNRTTAASIARTYAQNRE